MTCTDDFIDCKKMQPYCKTAGLGPTPIYQVCKRSCGYNCQGFTRLNNFYLFI